MNLDYMAIENAVSQITALPGPGHGGNTSSSIAQQNVGRVGDGDGDGDGDGGGIKSETASQRLQRIAKCRWLQTHEIDAIFNDPAEYNLFPSTNNMSKPISGSILMFDKTVFAPWRNDGYQWKKRKNGKSQECHVR